ncbi:hypothetical protein [Caminibacter sp.]
MKRWLVLIPFLITGCSFTNTTTKVTNFAKCYIHQIPAPFWVCYQSSFQVVGKVKTDKVTRLKQEEAFSVGMTELITKLNAKTMLFLRKIGKDDKHTLDRIKNVVKNFVVVNAIQGASWYSKKEKMLYVQVKIDKDAFKKVLLSQFKNIDKKTLQAAFDEVF